MKFGSNFKIKFNETKELSIDTFKLLARLSNLRIPNYRAIFNNRSHECTK